MTKLGAKIHALRKERGLTLEELANAAGASKSYVWELENKASPRPSAKKLTAIADALGVPMTHLTEDDDRSQTEKGMDESFFRMYKKLTIQEKELMRWILRYFSKTK